MWKLTELHLLWFVQYDIIVCTWIITRDSIYLSDGWIIEQESPAIADKPRDAKACQKLLQFDVLTTLSLTILAYLHSFSCCCIRNLQNSMKIQTYGIQGHPRSSILVSIESPCTTSYWSLIVTLAVSATIFKILTLKAGKLLNFHTLPFFEAP